MKDIPYGTYEIYELRMDALDGADLVGLDYDALTTTQLGTSIYSNIYYIYCDAHAKFDVKDGFNYVDSTGNVDYYYKENTVYTVDSKFASTLNDE